MTLFVLSKSIRLCYLSFDLTRDEFLFFFDATECISILLLLCYQSIVCLVIWSQSYYVSISVLLSGAELYVALELNLMTCLFRVWVLMSNQVLMLQLTSWFDVMACVYMITE